MDENVQKQQIQKPEEDSSKQNQDPEEPQEKITVPKKLNVTPDSSESNIEVVQDDKKSKPWMNWVIIILLVIIVLGLGYYFLK